MAICAAMIGRLPRVSWLYETLGGCTLNKPYVGISGFMNRGQVEQILAQLESLDFPAVYQLMVGVLVSSKSLHRQPLKPIWANKYPDPAELGTIFAKNPRVFNAVHFNTKEPGLADQLARIVELTPNLDGFQLNIAWPDPAELVKFQQRFKGLKIVLQLGRRAMEGYESGSLDGNSWLRGKLEQYRGLVDYVLFDSSGGLGLPMDAEYTIKALLDVRRWPDRHFRVAVAGGLSPENVFEGLSALMRSNPGISWDAEGLLRTNGQLDLGKCSEYLRASVRLINNIVEEHLKA